MFTQRRHKVVCPVCGNDETRKLFEKQGCTFVKCIHDGLVYVNPQPTMEELREIYDTGGNVFYKMKDRLEETYDSYGNRFYRLPESISASAYYRQYQRRFQGFRNTNRLLEIGTAGGAFLVRCRNDGWCTHGVELSISSASFAREQQRLDVITGTIHDASYQDNYFDVVVAWQTLEHVPDPREVITEIFRILRPGGFFAFSVPCWNGLSIRLLKERYRYVGRDHLFYFSRQNISHMLADIGFSNIRTKTRSFNPIACYQDARTVRRGSRERQTKIGKVNTPMAKQLMKGSLAIFIYRTFASMIGNLNFGDILFGEVVK